MQPQIESVAASTGFTASRSRLIELDCHSTIKSLSCGARALGLAEGDSWHEYTDGICHLQGEDFQIIADGTEDGGQFLVLNPLKNQQTVLQAFEAIAACTLGDIANTEGKVGNALARAVATINEAIRQSLNAAHKITHDAADLSSLANLLNDRSTSVASQLARSTATLEELDHTISSNLDATKELSRDAQKINTDIQQSRQAFERILGQMRSIASQVLQTRRIVEAIDEIAFKTNILALNAAVEAARAGESGRGFSVVAQEVRNLATNTSEQATEIRQLLDSVRASSDEGESVVTTAGNSIEELFDVVQSIASRTEDIQNSSNEQAEGMRESTQAMQSIADLNEKNTGLSEQLTTVATGMNTEIGFMKDSLEVFKLIDGFSHPLHADTFTVTRATADAIGKVFEAAIASGKITVDALFDRDHQEIANTNPCRYQTRFDELCDTLLPPIQEAALGAHSWLIYIIATDTSGYVPTHNDTFCQALTGNPEQDLVGNRTKRIFTDRVGQSAGAHQEEYKLLTYRRDTGEIMLDLSCPIYVNSKHWGGVRTGYRL